jgi:hypothetical protein
LAMRWGLHARPGSAHAMPGAMGIIQPRRHRCWRASVSSCAARSARRKDGAGQAIWPLSTRVKRSALHPAAPGPTQTVRVMSVVPSGYCPPDRPDRRWRAPACGWSPR